MLRSSSLRIKSLFLGDKMLHASKGSLRCKTWKLPNGYWKGCNLAGKHGIFRLQVEAIRFAEKGINEVTSTFADAVSDLEKQGYNVTFSRAHYHPDATVIKSVNTGGKVELLGRSDKSVVATAIKEEKEITLQAVRTQREADDIAKRARHMEGVIRTEVRPLDNGQFQVVLIKKN